MKKERVIKLVEEALAENDALFLIDIEFLPDNKISVEVDSDTGLPLKECMRISRHVEHNLDREEEDFSLEVSSPDITEPLKVKRQYLKNMNRILKVKLQDDSRVEGRLTRVGEENIMLEWKVREPKPIGKGKITVDKQKTILYTDIIEAKVKIIFN